ncbi:MAG: hypothetical protein C4326_03755 [Ignavibacteria bacterium]
MTPFDTEDMRFLVAVDVTHPNDNDERLNLGGELRLFERVAVRGGYRFGYDIERATLGAGIEAPLGDVALRFDYAYTTYQLLPNVHRISLGMVF